MDILAFNPPTPTVVFFGGWGGFILYFCGSFPVSLHPWGTPARGGELWAPKGVSLVSPTEGIPHFSMVFLVVFLFFNSSMISFPQTGGGGQNPVLAERGRESSS